MNTYWLLLYTVIKTHVMGPQTYCVVILLGFHKTTSDQDVTAGWTFSKGCLIWLQSDLLRQKVRNQRWRICTPQPLEPMASNHAQGIHSCLRKRCPTVLLVSGSAVSMAALQPATLESHRNLDIIWNTSLLHWIVTRNARERSMGWKLENLISQRLFVKNSLRELRNEVQKS